MESKAVQIGYLVRFLLREDVTRDQKIAETKATIATGVVTKDEGLDLFLEFA